MLEVLKMFVVLIGNDLFADFLKGSLAVFFV